jgi:hypothetical protein
VAERRLQQFGAALQRVGPTQELLERVVGDGRGFLALQPHDVEGRRRGHARTAATAMAPRRLLVQLQLRLRQRAVWQVGLRRRCTQEGRRFADGLRVVAGAAANSSLSVRSRTAATEPKNPIAAA